MANFLYDAIIFDFDGVLVQSVDIKASAFSALYESYGQEIMDKVLEYHNSHGGVSRYEKFKHYHNNLLGVSLSTEEMNKLDEQFSKWVVQKVINAPEVSGAHTFLQKFHRLISCYVVSATPHVELVNIIEKRHMSAYFASVHGAPEKKVDLINKILVRDGYDNSRVLMIGDALSDYHAALEAGIQFVGCVTTNENIFPLDVATVNDLTSLNNLLQ